MASLQDFEPHFIELTFGKWAELLVQFQERERLIQRYEVELGEQRVRQIRSEEAVHPTSNNCNDNGKASVTASSSGSRLKEDGPSPPKRMNVTVAELEEIPQPVSQQQLPSQGSHELIWKGTLEWHEKQRDAAGGLPIKTPRLFVASAFARVVNSIPVVNGDNWPGKLIMQLIPKSIIGILGANFLVQDVKTVHLSFVIGDTLNSLTRVMDAGYGGVVHFPSGGPGTIQGDPEKHIQVLILLYSRERQDFIGFIPNDQTGFVQRIRDVIQKEKAVKSNTLVSVKH